MIIATSKERIVQFIKSQGIASIEFLLKTGIKRGFLDADKLKATVSDVFLAKIIAVYPDLNLYWVVTGKGDMLISENKKDKSKEVDQHILDVKEHIINLQFEKIKKMEAELAELKPDPQYSKPKRHHLSNVAEDETKLKQHRD